MDLSNPYKNTILIVDDMPDNITVLLAFLSNVGFRVLVTPNGEQGVKTAEYARPDLILLDVMMPGIDGFEVCRLLKSQPRTRDIPIIFMTALADIVDKVKGFKLGAADYITKPIQHEEVLARVNAHLTLHQLQKQLSEQNRQLQEEITIRKAVEASLKQRNEELDAFAHMVAHDLKNPLTATISLTELLLDTLPTAGPPSPRWKETLTVVVRSARKMFSIIEALLLLAGIVKWSPLEMKPLDMPKIIEQVLQQRLQSSSQVHTGEIILM
ncbi:MAG: hybrid sensor histidine kinase/response regulator, partial [Beggiatoa sp. IS2]